MSAHSPPDSGPSLAANLAQWRELIDRLMPLEEPLRLAADRVGDCLLAGHKLIACGNGGSASDTSHLCAEFVCRFDKPRGHYPAIALSDSTSTLTAMGNDYSYDEAFARQLRAFARPGDVFLAFSTSGNSPSIERALQTARELAVPSIAFLGKGGGICAGLADIELLVPHRVTARVQEAHKLLMHTLCEMVEPRLA